MSSLLRNEKGKEELESIIEAFLLNYQSRMGKPADLTELDKRLNELMQDKEDQLFHELFEGLPLKNVAQCIDMIKDKQEPVKKMAPKGKSGKA